MRWCGRPYLRIAFGKQLRDKQSCGFDAVLGNHFVPRDCRLSEAGQAWTEKTQHFRLKPIVPAKRRIRPHSVLLRLNSR